MSIYHLNITFHSVILVDVRNIFNSCAERVNLRVNIENSYSEDYTDPYTSSFLHEPVCGWRLPANLDEKMGQEEFLNTIEANKDKGLKNSSDFSHYKSANTDVIGVLIEKISDKKLLYLNLVHIFDVICNTDRYLPGMIVHQYMKIALTSELLLVIYNYTEHTQQPPQQL